MADDTLTTIVSTKGQVIFPKAVREKRRWNSGTRLIVEDTADGVLLSAAPVFATTDPKDVFASLALRARRKPWTR